MKTADQIREILKDESANLYADHYAGTGEEARRGVVASEALHRLATYGSDEMLLRFAQLLTGGKL